MPPAGLASSFTIQPSILSQASETISGSRAPPPLQWERCICGSGSDVTVTQHTRLLLAVVERPVSIHTCRFWV